MLVLFRYGLVSSIVSALLKSRRELRNLCLCWGQDDCLIGMGATVMDKAVIEKGSIVAAGAVVTSGTVVKTGEIWVCSLVVPRTWTLN